VNRKQERFFEMILHKVVKKCVALLLTGVMMLLLPGMELLAQAATPTYMVMVNRQENCVTVYKKDSEGNYTVPYKAMICSTGGELTPLGTYKVPIKYEWRALVEETWGQYATRIDGPYLFHSVPYDDQDPSTLLPGEFDKLGEAASHGCIRMTVEDAKWIYDNIAVGTTVIIYDDDNPGPLGKPETVKIGPEATWDPTDIWSEGNPYIDKTPEIHIEGTLRIRLGQEEYDLMHGVSAISSTGEDITEQVAVEGAEGWVPEKTGVYRFVYHVVDKIGREAERTRYVRVTR